MIQFRRPYSFILVIILFVIAQIVIITGIAHINNVSANVGVPSVDIDYDVDVEDWWESHALNPDNPNGASIGQITSPSTIINVEPDGDCSDESYVSNIQTALDNLPALPTTGYTFQFEAGIYCGNFRIHNDYEESGDTFVKTLNRDNIHFLGSTEGETIFSTSGSNPTHNTNVVTTGEILGCPDSENYTTFGNAARSSANPLHDRALHCIQNPIKNIYMKDIVFDGNNQNAFLLHVRTVRDVVLDRVTFRNASSVDQVTTNHHAPIFAMATLKNFWCRGCNFVNNGQEYQIYIDGVHGGGVIYSNIGQGPVAGGILYLTNNDMTLDRDDDGLLESPQEYGHGQYVITYKNTFHGANGSATHNAIGGGQMANSLIKDNLSLGTMGAFVQFDVPGGGLPGSDGATPLYPTYVYTGNKVIGNIVRSTLTFARVTLNNTCSAGAFAAGTCSTVGDNLFKDNVAYVLRGTNYIYAIETWNAAMNGADRILQSTLENNCINGGILPDGLTPGSTGGPQPVVDTTTPCDIQPPVGPAYPDNVFPNGSFENLTAGYPTGWGQPVTASSSTVESYTGDRSIRLTGPAAGTYIRTTISPQLTPSTEYIMSARVKATNLNIQNGSSFFQLRYIENGGVRATSNQIRFETDYWTYITFRFSTSGTVTTSLFDLLYTLEGGDEVFLDDVELYPVSDHIESIEDAELNPFNLTFNIPADPPTGSIVVNANASSTNSRDVTLTLAAQDYIDADTDLEMWISNDSNFSTGSYEAFATAKAWTLTPGDGSKTVYVRFRDEAGNISNTYFDAISFTAPVDPIPDPDPVPNPNPVQNGNSNTPTQTNQGSNTVPIRPISEILTIPIIATIPDLQESEGMEQENGKYLRLQILDEDGNPVVNAKVTIKELNIQTFTDNEGYINLGNIEYKNYTIEIEFDSKTTVEILGITGEDSVVTIVLKDGSDRGPSIWPIVVVMAIISGAVVVYINQNKKQTD